MTKKQSDASRRAQLRQRDDVAKKLTRWSPKIAPGVSGIPREKLRIIPLGGQDGIGAMNMIVVEYENDAIVLDCGFDLSVDLPGVNYAIPVIDYLRGIRHKLRGYVISHGHLDHIGGLIHIVPQCPAPIYGSRFTTGMVQQQFDKANEEGLGFDPTCVVLDMDTHERIRVGIFTVELIRVTHAIPESSAIAVDTPVGRLINTGDYRLDPEPLDAKPTDIARLKELGDEGVLLLMSESTNITKPGRTPTEHTLQESFDRLIERAPGRVFVAVFSTNMNRVQMIISAAAAQGRKVAFDGRSMIATAELAVRLGNLKIPQGTLVPMREVAQVPDGRVVVLCTGGQGEPNASLQRMSVGEHQSITLCKSDTVITSSTPIPGNEVSYQQLGNDLAKIGVQLYRHPTHEIDGCGPLHVSGHGNRDESVEMMQLVRPRYLMPIYGGPLDRKYHQELAIEAGMSRQQVVMANNGEVIELGLNAWPRVIGRVTTGAVLVDQTGAEVPGIVTKDRLLLRDEGIVVVMLTVSRTTGKLLTSPDIISRGFVYLRDKEQLINGLRQMVRLFVAKRPLQGRETDVYKAELHKVIAAYLRKHAPKRMPVIVPVVNLVNQQGRGTIRVRPVDETA